MYGYDCNLDGFVGLFELNDFSVFRNKRRIEQDTADSHLPLNSQNPKHIAQLRHCIEASYVMNLNCAMVSTATPYCSKDTGNCACCLFWHIVSIAT